MSRYHILKGKEPPKPPKPKCPKCGDTGVWETGNNDLPCDECSAGDTAMFNVAGENGPLSGAELKRRGI